MTIEDTTKSVGQRAYELRLTGLTWPQVGTILGNTRHAANNTAAYWAKTRKMAWPLKRAVPICRLDGCEERGIGQGYCSIHYQRLMGGRPLDRPHRNAPLEERLPFLIDKSGDCWTWKLTPRADGYGRTHWRGRSRQAHCAVYEMLVGPIPEGRELDHLCRNRICVNPAHLEPVTHRVNCLRGESPAAHNARKTHCKRGHSFNEANTYFARDGSRHCRICHRDLERRLRSERKGSQNCH